MSTNVHFVGMEATDALKEYVDDRVEDLRTYFDDLTGADVHLGKDSQHHQKGDVYFAEFKLMVPGQSPLVVKKVSDDLYKAVDKVKDHLKVELEKLKGKMNQVDRQTLRDQKGYQE